MVRIIAWTLLLAVLGAGSAWAGEDGLDIGDPAPALDIAYWVKGVDMDRRGNFEPITEFKAGTIYVIEFWATWCPPCRAGMPHLSEVQETYADKNVRVIGVSDESLPKVVEFLFQTDKDDGKVQNDRTHYMLTTDPDRSTHRDYMDAAGQSGIPTSFIVGKDGKIEWIGHPMQMDGVLEKVVNDTWDREAFKIELETQKKLEKAFLDAQPRIGEAVQTGDWPAVVAILDELLAIAPKHARLNMEKAVVLLTQYEDEEAALSGVRAIVENLWENAQVLNAVAWEIATNPNVQHRDLDLALKAAVRADELTEHADGAILDTVARVYYEKGDLEKAVEAQKKAIEHAENEDMKREFEAALERYQKEQQGDQGSD